jgi:cytochrome c oxidase assembly factor CtaG
MPERLRGEQPMPGWLGPYRYPVTVAVAGAAPFAAAAVTVLRLGPRGYAAVNVDAPGPGTALASALGRSVVLIAALLTVGGLVTAVLLRADRTGHRPLRVDPRVTRRVGQAGTVWGLAAAVLVLVDAADVNGQPVTALAGAGGLTLIRAAYLPRAWIVTVLAVTVLVLTVVVARSWASHAVLAVPAGIAALAPVLVGHVLVGPDHDFAGDATILGLPVALAWLGATAFGYLFWDEITPSTTSLRRYAGLAAVGWPVVTGSTVVVAVVETGGTAPWRSSTGQLFGVQLALLTALGAVTVRWWRRGPRSGPGAAAATHRFLGTATLLLSGYLAAEIALTRIPPPNYFVPTSIAENFLGYDVVQAPTLARLAGYGRLNLLFAVLATVAIGTYLAGVRRLHRRGDPWPAGRTAAWLAGWLLVVATTSSGVGRYSGASFSVHMALHMSLNMFAPAVLVLGGPATLLLRAVPARPPHRPAGPHEWLAALLSWRLTRSFFHPLHALIAYTASYYLLYFSDVFNQASRYHWAHQLMNLEFLAIGTLFFGLVVGVDAPPRPLPHIARLGLVLATMPFHAFFGVVVMTSDVTVAATFYRYLATAAPWITDLRHDQYVGGGIAWAAGEVPLTFVVIVLLVQWSRQDARQATRLDRHLDSGLDDSHDAYNAMLARLTAGPGTPGSGPDTAGSGPDNDGSGSVPATGPVPVTGSVPTTATGG